MIKAIEVTNNLGESVRLELSKPEKSGFIVKKVDGLGPVKADINFTELATNDGAIDNSARLESRNIVLELMFLPKPTIEVTRLASYKYFPIKKNVTVLVETDNRICEIKGRVESNEPDIFSEEEGCQISIMCGNPFFYSRKITKTTMGIESMFEFPFSNESLTENLIEFGRIHFDNKKTIYYDGDADVGITITVHSIGDVKGLVIFNPGTRDIMRINDQKLIELTGAGIHRGDTIIITTEIGNKRIKMLRDGNEINILNVLDKPVSWFKLKKGNNTLAYMASEGVTNLEVSIENKTLYEGI